MTSTSGFRVGLSTAASRGRGPIRSRSRSRTHARRIRATSRSGRPTSRTRTPGGTRPGAGAGRAGTSSAPRWRRQLLGPVFEIHGGGLDLVFPHHENELAQSRALGHEFAKIWMHNGMLRFTGEKMSKSLGNVETIQEVLDRWGRETALLFFLTAHWRSPIDFSDATMAAAQAQWRSFQRGVLREPRSGGGGGLGALRGGSGRRLQHAAGSRACMHEWRAASQLDLLQRGLDVFGLAFAPAAAAGRGASRSWPSAAAARASKDFAASDELRDRIDERGLGGSGRPRRLRFSFRSVTRELVYGRRPVREALRGPGRCSRSGRQSGRWRPSRGCATARACT